MAGMWILGERVKPVRSFW